MKKLIPCIVCPNGCDLEVEVDGQTITSIVGNRCPKGAAYAKEEITAPRRTIASSVLVLDGELPLVSVRVTPAIPKAMIPSVMEVIKGLSLQAPVVLGQVLVDDVLGTGSKIIATKSVARKN